MKNFYLSLCMFIMLVIGILPGYAQVTSLEEGFETVEGDQPVGWRTHEVPDSRPFKKGKFSGWGTNFARTGKCYMYTTTAAPSWGNPDAQRDNWLITPQLKYVEGAVFSFWARSKSAPAAESVPANQDERSSFEIKLSKAGTEITDFTISLLQVVKADAGEYHQYRVDLSKDEYNLTTDELFHIGIRVYDNEVMDEDFTRILYLDDVFYGAESAETPVASLSAESWQPSCNVDATVTSSPAFILSNTGDGTLTVKSVTDLSETAFSTTFNAADVCLAKGESYDFTFSYAPVAEGQNAKTFVIETDHGEQIQVQLTGTATAVQVAVLDRIDEDFEAGMPENWQIVDANEDDRTWKTSGASINLINGAKTVILEQGAGQQNDWLILPRVKVGAGYSFTFTVQSAMSSNLDHLHIKASKTGAMPADFSLSVATDIEVPAEATTLSYSLPAVDGIKEGDELYIAIQCVSPAASGFFVGKLLLDDVSVKGAEALSDAKEIVACQVAESVSVTVDAEKATVDVLMPAGTDLSAISPEFTLSEKAAISPDTPQDFSAGTVVFTVTAEDGSTKAWHVSIDCEQNSACEIISCSVTGQLSSKVDAENAKVYIVMPEETDLRSLEPEFELSANAQITPEGPHNFVAAPYVYTVTAQDGSTKEWHVCIECFVPAVEGLDESFESEGLPQGWETVDADGNGKDWFVIDYMPYHGKQIIKTKRNMKQNSDWLISPKVKVRSDDHLSFMYRSASVNYPETFKVLVSKDGKQNLQNFSIELATIADASAEVGFTEYNFALTSHEQISEGDEIYIAIQCISKDRMELHIDKFMVAPPPVEPQAALEGDHWRAVTEVNERAMSGRRFTLSNVLAGTLEISSIELPEGYATDLDPEKVHLGPEEVYSFSLSFAPIEKGDHNGQMVIHTNGGDLTIHLLGYAYGDDSYHEGFEEENSYRNWENRDADGDSYMWFPYQNYEYAPDLAHSGEYCVVSESAELSGMLLSPENWLISPKLLVGENDKLVFWVGAVSDISFREHYTVKLSTQGKDNDDFSHVLINDEELTSHEWKKVEVDLSEFAGEKVYIAFIHTGVTNESQLRMDDMVLPELYQAPTADLIVEVKPMEYTSMPFSQAKFNFAADVLNMGADLTTDALVRFSVEEGGYSEEVAISLPLNKEELITVKTPSLFKPKDKGEYTLNVEAVYEDEDYPQDNKATCKFSVDTVYARDKGVYNNYIGIQEGTPGAVGQVFEMFKEDKLTSLSFYQVAGPKDIIVTATIYQMGDNPGKALLTTEEVLVPANFEGWVTMPLTTPLTLEQGKYLFALNERAEDRLRVGVDQSLFTPNTVYIYYKDEWLLAEETQGKIKIAMLLRANFNYEEETTGIEKLENIAISCYPNPAREYFCLQNIHKANVEIYSISGELVKKVVVHNAEQRISTNQIKPGMYVIRIMDRKRIFSQKLLITK